VAHLRFGGAVNRLDRGSARVPVLRTPADVLKRLGRAVLWLVVVVLLLRGLASSFSTDPAPTVAPSPAKAVAVWPDDEARAFAADFARAYLSYSPGEPQSLERFVTPELASSIAPDFGDGEERQAVGLVSVARTVKLDESTALVTVAAVVNGDTRFLAVPVARDSRGGLVVSDLPSLVAPPARAVVDTPTLEPIASSERAAIEDVLSRFLRSYLAGDSSALEYLVPAGVRIRALAQKYELLGVTSLALAAPAKGNRREVWATVRARDVESRATYGLRYRLQLVREDRWYVAAVNETTPRGG
jgi:hypothetical protein